MTLLAAWQLLLARYSGQEDVSVGTPIAGRTRLETEPLIGFFVNTLVMRTDLSGDVSFRELLGRVRETTLGAFAHQEVPFERLVEELAPERSMAHSPLFQAMFALQNDTRGGLRMGELEMEPLASGAGGIAKFDLVLPMVEDERGFAGSLYYRAGLWDPPTMERMVGHFRALLASVTAEPARPLSRLELLDAAERDQLIGQCSGSRRDAAHLACVHEALAEQAARTPDAVALVYGDRALSYAELEGRSNRLAHRLHALGVGPEVRVGVCLERGVEMVVGVLGVLKAGGAYVPLDPAYPAERLAYTLADSGAALLVSQSGLRDVLPGFGGRVVCLDADREAIAGEPSAAPQSGVGLHNAAYVIYTSGSTGLPKGVVVEHACLTATLLATRDTFGLCAGEVMPGMASYAFDIWAFEVFAPLLAGGQVRLLERETVQDVERLAEELAGADAVHAVPALMREVVARVQAGPGTLPRMRRVFIGGDAIAPDLLEQTQAAFPAAQVWAMYGPTENTMISSATPLRRGERYDWQMVGRPLPGVGMYVLDPGGNLLPAGVPGELYLAGGGVARGYLGRAELTAERFVPDPFSADAGARLYRTGDRVRRRTDGELEFLGRVDQQVKVRGFRIEPGEIEAALTGHPSVREAVVAVREDAPGQKRLVAYVVPEEEGGAELWPSIGEYFVFDEMVYHGLTHDAPRNARYLRALQRHAPGKTVLDVGTGMDAIQARLAVEAGARHVYAVELLEESYLAARERVRELGLEDRITVLHGDARTVQLPEPAEVCVSEIVEAIAGGEGAATILNRVQRLMAPGGVMIPGLTQTCMAAVTLPEEIRREPAFSRSGAHYVRKIFAEVGHPCDVRLCIKDFPWQNRLSGVGVFEEMDFNRSPVPEEYVRVEELEVERAGRLDGLLLWLRMELSEGEVLDMMEEETSWFPVYFPLFDPGLEVGAGDRLRVESRGELHPTRVAPNYAVRGVLARRTGEEVPFEFVSDHHVEVYRHTPFYQRLFAEEGIPVRENPQRELPGALRAHLGARLPEHMVPSAFVVLERLPLSANGKLDRRALPAPQQKTAGYVAPRTPVEEVLAGIWGEVLQVESVGVEDDFFERGGHSLLATQVVSRVRRAFGVEVPLRTLFEAPTVAGLAGRIGLLQAGGEGTQAPPLVALPRDGSALPLSFAQQRLWLVDQLEPGNPAYHMPFPLLLRGALDLAALEHALSEIVRRHESLRTRIVSRDGEPAQQVDPARVARLPRVDLAGLDGTARRAELERLAAAEASRPFDLARGPLLRSTLVRLGREENALLFTMHHIVGDGWSLGVLVREFFEMYAARVERRAPALPELPVQYADYAVWQREWLKGETLERQLAWWRERLAGAPPVLELPTDRRRPAVRTGRGGSVALQVDAALSREVHALARRERATTFMVLLAAFSALLTRYSGQTDVVVGTPIANRGRGETEGLIGFFLNTLALRTDLSGDPAFRGLLGRVREATLGAYAHQDLPFERVIEELQPVRSLSHAPVFQVMLNLLNFADAGAGAGLPGVELEPLRSSAAEIAKYDLELYAQESPDGILLRLVYDAELFEPGRMAEALGHLRTLLEGVARDPDLPVSRLPLLTSAEREALSVRARGIGGGRPVPDFAREEIEQSIPARFAKQARLHPDAVAVRTRTTTLTYAELDRAADRVARALLRARPAGEERIALLFEHDAAMIVGILGVLRAGKTYVPIDPLYPRERSAYVLADSEAGALLTNRVNLAAARELAGDRVPVVEVGEEEEADDGFAAVAWPEVRPETPAYVLYTSGSTGQPKGVVQSHRNVLHFIQVYTHNLRIGPDDRLTLFSSYTFDAAVMAIYGALLNGASLFPFDWREEAPAGIAWWMRRERITLYHSTPTVFRHLTGSLVEAERFPDVRLVVLGGEETQRRDVQAFQLHFLPGATLVNGLGPTESTVTLQHFVEHGTEPARGTVPVGHPVEDTDVLLENGIGEQVAVYGTGEIVIRSPYVALGYWRKPEQTAAAFSEDSRSGARSYRTGDLGRRLPGGMLEFIGRSDFQVKIRGFRVEPGEVEASLRGHPAVREAVVVPWEDASGERRLAAYVVVAEGAEAPPAAGLREWLRARFPEYMVPAAFIPVEELPLTPNGKVDRLALPAPAATADAEYQAPRGWTEELLAGFWSQVLGVERVGAHDDFFELGGHSLLATQVVSRAGRVFGVEVPLRAVFEAPTVAELAARIDALRLAGSSSVPPIERAERAGALPLSFAQQRLWLMDRLEPGSAAYNMPFALRLRGPADVEALRRSIEALTLRHETLRTSFGEQEGEPVQVIHPGATAALEVVDLRALPAEVRELEAERLAEAEALRPFELSRGPLLRSTLLRLGGDDHVLLFTLHHIVSDGWSLQVLVREFSTLYAGFGRGEAPALPELSVQYADYAAWQRRWLSGEVLEAQLDFWRTSLGGAPPLLEVPTDHPRRVEQSARAAGCRLALSAEVSGRLRALARREGATLFMTVLSGWQALLARWSGQDDVVVGTPVAGRTQVELEGLIGFFVNMLPLRADLGGDPTFGGLLGRVREAAMGAYAHQELPFERLVEELVTERSLTHTPLFQVAFGLERAGGQDGTLTLGDVRLEPFGRVERSARYDLDLVMGEAGDALAGVLVYRAVLFEPATIARTVGHLEATLAAMAADPDGRISEVPLLRDAERAQLLEEWQGAHAAYPETPVHRLVAEQAARTPDAVAVLHGERVLTYADLERESARVAHVLRSRGVGPESRVAICLERSAELAVALLGTLRAGGAYVPLDPAYPRERLAYLLADSGARAVLTRSGVADVLPAGGPERICLDAGPDTGLPATDEADVDPDHLAYVIYTSGSTGAPKGVMVSHRSLVCYADTLRVHLELGAGDRVLQFASPAFDVMVEEIFPAWLAGAAVVFPEGDLLGSLRELTQVLKAQRISVVELPTAFWHEWVRSITDEGLTLPPGLRRVLVGGERVLPERLAEWSRLGVPLTHVFGLTETTVTSATLRLEAGDDGSRWSNLPVGSALPNVRLYVLDAGLQPVPVGVPGELYIGGDGVARGYAGRPALTADRFVPDAFGEPGARSYRTGDRVRWLSDGTLEFLGRVDTQAKIRGYRIEPAEVEAALAEHPRVREAAVVVREDVPGDKRLVGYVVPTPGYRAGVGGLHRRRVELWPSHGEAGYYDEAYYLAMAEDHRRNRGYLEALRRTAVGKVVVDVGTGAKVVLSRLAVEAGARKVYAIEIKEESFRKAQAFVKNLGLEDRIVVIKGDGMELKLPEPADVCVSELIGCVGGSEGAIAILNTVWGALKPDGVQVPQRCATRIAAVELPPEVHGHPALEEVQGYYAEKIFEAQGHREDLKMCIRNFPREGFLSESDVWEDLLFTGPLETDYTSEIELPITRDGRMDGFLMWIQLYVWEDLDVDALEHDSCWLPMFFPAFYPGVEVRAGEVIRGRCITTLAEDGVHPDYRVQGVIHRLDGREEPFVYDSFWRKQPEERNPFHAELFPGGVPVVRAPEAEADGALHVSLQELREHVAERLPEYMVPPTLVPLDALPLTPNGKVDRRALPAPEPGSTGAEHVEPRTATEEVLCGIFAEVLRLERVGVEESFFSLGGHSLLAMRVASRVRQTLGVELPLRTIFEAPAVAGLAARIGALQADGKDARVPPLVATPRDGSALPLSFAQQRLWFIDQLEPGSAAYNVRYALRLRGLFDPAVLERSLTEIVRRHETLRTVFATVDGEPVQVVLDVAPLLLPVMDLRSLYVESRQAEILRLAREEAVRPFDLAGGPLLRASVARLGEAEWGVLFTMHHIVSDGWSTGVLIREVSELYDALAEGREPVLPELPVQYADYAAWQRSWLTGETLEAELGWWRASLAGAPPLLELPTDRPRPQAQDPRGASVRVSLPREVSDELRALSHREGATAFMTLLATWQLLLSRYSGQEDVSVGTPIAGRTRLETEPLIGFFVNTLVLRTDLSGEPTFRDLLGRVRETTLGAHQHQEIPFERLVEELAPERSLAHTPLFQAMFVFDDDERGGLRMGELEMEPLAVGGAESAKFDLTLGLTEFEEGYLGSLSYRSELWERATMERMAEHFARLVEAGVADPRRPVTEVSILGEAERERLLVGWNATEAGYPAGDLVHELFAAQALRTPDAVALAFGAEETTYAGLDAAANRLARLLRRRGVGPESRVGIFLERRPELLVAMLGVLKTGGAYVPLDPAYPSERLGYMVEDSAVALVLTTSGLADRIAGVVVVDLNAVAAESEGEPATAPETGVGPENLSHVIFTSGSTGRPKGVMIRHASTAVLMHWMRENVSDEERSSVLWSTSINFDVSVAEVFGTLCWGGKLVLVENALSLATVERAIVYASMVPTAAAELLRMGAIPASVKTLNLGGEALTNELAQALYATGTVEKVGNLYGPTEDTTYSTYSLVEKGAAQVLVGRPVANTQAYVLDRHMEPVPTGVVGELYLAGEGTARGYASRSELTAERFVPNPFGVAGSRMYRVMDRVRRRADGELEYFGRTDFQVKVRGFRIEPGEIEVVLERHERVHEAVVVAREDAPGEVRLVAYVVAGGGEVPAAELRTHLKAHLPEHMVPSAFVPLAVLPLTASGKIDRRALPAPESSGDSARYVAPRTPAEEVLAGIFADVLRVERVGSGDDFFDLGGHSLLATRVMSRVRQAFGVELPLRALFEAPTVALLTERVEAACRASVQEWELDDALDRLDHLSDEDVMKLLERTR
jgi:amino acid adenylation domain-containing protein